MNESSQSSWRSRSCPACDAAPGNPWLEKGALRVVRCPQCGMLFASPVNPELQDGTFYNRLATAYHLSPDKLESDYAQVRFARELRVFRRYCPRGTVLDVGCSTGAFLHALISRFPGAYSVLGHDVAGPALDHAERHGVPVLRGSFLEHEFGGRQFDAVTFWAVLEHLDHPCSFLEKAAKVLVRGGHTFVLVPNMKSLAVRLLGSRYRYIMDEHLNYFTLHTLRRAANRSNFFEVVSLQSTHFNPVVLWQDWRRDNQRVPDAERAQLLRRTTGWKQSRRLAPLRWFYTAIESGLGAFHLADNLLMVLRRR